MHIEAEEDEDDDDDEEAEEEAVDDDDDDECNVCGLLREFWLLMIVEEGEDVVIMLGLPNRSSVL